MRYYVDTNIMIFLVSDRDRLTKDVAFILGDYSNNIYISSECVKELIILHQGGNINIKQWKNSEDIIKFIIDETSIEIKPIGIEHLKTLAKLPRYKDHKDPFDRIIVAHAITEKVPIISSDTKFHRYKRYGLELIFND